MIDDLELPDDSTRPVAPEIATAKPPSAHSGSTHLRAIHDHHRQNMRILQKIIARAAEGTITPEAAEAEAQALPILENYRRFGAMCGQYCQIIHTHHTIEDQHMFPAVSAKSKAWNKVIDRLKAEHEVVHELLLRTINAINTLAQTNAPSDFANARLLYETLERLLLSHFSYEENTIGPALDHFEISV